jgi:hypothetical protein
MYIATLIAIKETKIQCGDMVSDVENGLIGVKSEGVEYAVLREVG